LLPQRNAEPISQAAPPFTNPLLPERLKTTPLLVPLQSESEKIIGLKNVLPDDIRVNKLL
jgi:hypothetical protein